MGRLTTHVLDTATGKPAAGLKIEVWAEKLLKTIHTNSDGRADAPLLEGDALKPGQYEFRINEGGQILDGGSIFLRVVEGERE